MRSKEELLEIYHARKNNLISYSDLYAAYHMNGSNINYLIRLIDMHGEDILRDARNAKYSKEFKLNAINRVLIGGEAVRTVSLEIGLTNCGILFNWIRKYKENGYNVIEKKKGRKPMTKIPDFIPKENETSDEKLKRLEQEVEYLRAENAYLKKLQVVVQKKRKKQRTKKKH